MPRKCTGDGGKRGRRLSYLSLAAGVQSSAAPSKETRSRASRVSITRLYKGPRVSDSRGSAWANSKVRMRETEGAGEGEGRLRSEGKAFGEPFRERERSARKKIKRKTESERRASREGGRERTRKRGASTVVISWRSKLAQPTGSSTFLEKCLIPRSTWHPRRSKTRYQPRIHQPPPPRHFRPCTLVPWSNPITLRSCSRAAFLPGETSPKGI